MTLFRLKKGDTYVMSWDGPGCRCGAFPGTGVLWRWWIGETLHQLYQCHACARVKTKQPTTLHPPERIMVFKGRPKGARRVIPRRTEATYSRRGLTVFEAASDKADIGEGDALLAVDDKTKHATKRITGGEQDG